MEQKGNKNGNPDLHEKALEAYNDVFADIVNVVLFEGKNEVAENELRDANGNTTYWGNGSLRGQSRDVAKFWKNARICIAYFGFENQTWPDPDMPLRVIGYDGAAYRGQLFYVKGKNGKRKMNRRPRYPVITVVLYFGYKTRWTGARRLTEVIKNIPEGLKPFVNDYEAHVVEVAWMTDEELERLTSDFRIVADFFVQKRKNGNYAPSERQMLHVRETLGLLSAVTGDGRFEDTMVGEEGEEVPKTMCEVLDRIENRGRKEGRKEGRVAEYVDLRREDGYSAERIVQGLMERFQLTRQQAKECLK